jgi:hypothetical protein
LGTDHTVKAPGCGGFIQKPFTMAKLLRMARSIIGEEDE